MTTVYNLPPKAIPTYTTTSSGSYTNQLTNNGVSPAVAVSVFVSSTDLPNVFFDSLAMLPCYVQYKVPGQQYSLYCTPRTIANQDPTEDFIEVKSLPDPLYTPSSSSLAGVIKTIQANISTVTTNLATQVSKESSDVAALTTTVSSHTTSITSLNNSFTTLQAQVTALMTMVSTMNTNLNLVLASDVTFGLLTLSGSTYSNNSANIQTAAQILANKTAIATNTSNIASLKSNINSNISISNTNSSAYNALGTVQCALGSNKSPQMQNLSTVTSF